MIRVVRLSAEDAPEVFEAITRSRALHEPWVAPPAGLAELQEHLGQSPGVRISYGVREGAGHLVGVININSIIRGAFQSAFLGYYAFTPYQGRGFMHAGLVAVVDLAFGEHQLHRVEANVQPGNLRSARLVRRVGFRLEGHSPRYLWINGEWRDHDRYALTAEEWR